MSNRDVSQNKKAVSQEETLPSEINSLLEEIEPVKRKQITEFFAMSQVRNISPEIEVSKKITPEHISEMIRLQNKAMDTEFNDRKASRKYTLRIQSPQLYSWCLSLYF